MAWLIMNDEVDYPVMWYPTHIVSKEKKLLPVFIGASQTLIKGLVGLWIKDEHYELIDHTKAYIFIHDPEAKDESIESIDWDEIPDVNRPQTTGRDHIHIWKEIEKEGNA